MKNLNQAYFVGLFLFYFCLPIYAQNQTEVKNKQAGFIFDPKLNQVHISEPFLNYKINDQMMKIGQSEISEKTILFPIVDEQMNVKNLKLEWDSRLIQNGRIEILNQQGAVLFSEPIDPKRIDNFTNQILISQFEDKLTELIKNKNPMRFCLANIQATLCSPYYLYDQQVARFVKTAGLESNRVFLNSEQLSVVEGQFQFQFNTDYRISFENKMGFTYNININVQAFQIMEVVENERSGLSLFGQGFAPAGAVVQPKSMEHSFWYEYKPEPLFFEQKYLWNLEIEKSDRNQLLFLPDQGGMFLVDIQAKSFPLEKDRPQIFNSLDLLTYREQTQIRILSSGQNQLKDSEGKDLNQSHVSDRVAQVISVTNPVSKFTKGEQQIQVQTTDNRQFIARSEFYRGANSELSLRMTGLINGGQLTTLGELKYDHWFENLPYLDDHEWSRLRFGVSLRHSRNFQNLQVNQAESTSQQNQSMHQTVLDIKYRQTPGLWNRDQTIGPIVSYQNLNIFAQKINVLGVGGYWARSMPQFFDQVMNLLPFFRYPKYVDMEYLIYPVSLSKNMQVNQLQTLNFHGKVAWSKDIFGEAGFGLRQIALTNQVDDYSFQFNSFYFTMGLGYHF